jgi:hypothetical protein
MGSIPVAGARKLIAFAMSFFVKYFKKFLKNRQPF